MLTYWLVIGIAALAVIAVFVVVSGDLSKPQEPESDAGKPVWVALGSSGRPPSDRSDVRDWAQILGSRLKADFDIQDLTENGCTAAELQRGQLKRARTLRPALVSLLIGPDDFRDATHPIEFTRRFQHIVETLADDGATVVVAKLPPLSSLPSLANDDPDQIDRDREQWNDAIQLKINNHGGHAVDLVVPEGWNPREFFTETEGRYILTPNGQEWLATAMYAVIGSIQTH